MISPFPEEIKKHLRNKTHIVDKNATSQVKDLNQCFKAREWPVPTFFTNQWKRASLCNTNTTLWRTVGKKLAE